MQFEYNGNLLEDDRIILVANEIVNKYPGMDIEKAKEAAMLEGRISKEKTINDELNRLYNLMLVSCNNKDMVSLIYKDFLNILRNNKLEESNIYYYIIDEINNFLQNDVEFPILSDYQY